MRGGMAVRATRAWLAAAAASFHKAIRAVALAIALASTLSQQPAQLPPNLQLFEPPAVSVITQREVSDDMSCGVRIERDDRSLDVWMVAPLSKRWDAAAAAKPLAQQLDELDWPSEATEPARIRRIPPPALSVLRAARAPVVRVV